MGLAIGEANYLCKLPLTYRRIAENWQPLGKGDNLS